VSLSVRNKWLIPTCFVSLSLPPSLSLSVSPGRSLALFLLPFSYLKVRLRSKWLARAWLHSFTRSFTRGAWPHSFIQPTFHKDREPQPRPVEGTNFNFSSK